MKSKEEMDQTYALVKDALLDQVTTSERLSNVIEDLSSQGFKVVMVGDSDEIGKKVHSKPITVGVVGNHFLNTCIDTKMLQACKDQHIDVLVVDDRPSLPSNMQNTTTMLLKNTRLELEQLEYETASLENTRYEGEYGTEHKKTRRMNNGKNQYVDLAKKKRKKKQSQHSKKINRRK